MFDDPGTCYIEGLVSTNLQPLVKDESENECVQQSKEIEKCFYDNSQENEEGFESGYLSLDLQHVLNYQLGNKDDSKSTSLLDMVFFPPGVSFQPTLSSNLEYCYFQQSQQIFQPLGDNQHVKSHENNKVVEGVKHDCCFVHILEDPFAVLLEAMNNPNVF